MVYQSPGRYRRSLQANRTVFLLALALIISDQVSAARDFGARCHTSGRSRARSFHNPSLAERLSHATPPNRTSWCDTMSRALAAYEDVASAHLWDDILEAVERGSAPNPEENVVQWMNHKCNPEMWRRLVRVAPYPSCGQRASPSSVRSPACAGLRTCAHRHSRNASYSPHIAIVLGATSRNLPIPSVDNMALFTISLPSIVKTVECGFRYTVFLGYDVGDPFFDSQAGRDTLTAWFDQHGREPLLKGGINIDLVPVRVGNPGSKPGPVFNKVAERARSANADFFYRINDDTLLLTPWARAFACSLCSLGPPYGVVGPVESVRGDILTHDFVHAMHLDVFPEYYPSNLTDWWLDDWVSKVYGPARSYRLAEVKVSRAKHAAVCDGACGSKYPWSQVLHPLSYRNMRETASINSFCFFTNHHAPVERLHPAKHTGIALD